jgi:cobyrinic acid a,c-diamide synthase
MYLTRSIAWNAQRHEMVGFIAADTVMHATPQGRGLTILEETDAAPWPQAAGATGKGGMVRIPAHEFHHAALERLDPATRFAYRVIRGYGIDGRHDGIVKGNALGSFCHMRSTARGGNWAARFVAFVRARKHAALSRSA